MRISLCLPCHRREADLFRVLPYLADAVRVGMPAELVIVDYANPAPLEATIREEVGEDFPLVVPRYTGRTSFHMAHARNIGIRAATGDVIVIGSADMIPAQDFLAWIRARFEETGATWLYPTRYMGFIACRRAELVAAGGFDERFEFYGPEDKDLHARLMRRGAKAATYPSELVSVLPTPDAEKVAHYREKISKREMSNRGKNVYQENVIRGALTANDGLEWGAA